MPSFLAPPISFISPGALASSHSCERSFRGPVSHRPQAVCASLASGQVTPIIVGPFCPLLTQPILHRHVQVLCARRKSPAKKSINAATELEVAKKQVKERQRGRAEWTYAKLIISLLQNSVESPYIADAFYSLALVSQKRDVALARYSFQLAVQFYRNATGSESRTRMAKCLVSWGLFESKQPNCRMRAQRLVRRAVQIDSSNEPVLRWKSVFSSG